MLKGRNIVCFGGNIFSPSKVILPRIMEIFARNNKVLWINALPIRFPSIKKSKEVFLKKIINKLKIHIIPFRKKTKNFYILSPFFLPIFRNTFFKFLNNFLIRCQINVVQKFLKYRSPIVWANGFTALPTLGMLNERIFIYHLSDKYSAFRDLYCLPEKRKELEKDEKILIQYADLVLCSSYKLYEYAKQIAMGKEKIIYFPHGVDYKHFVMASMNNLPLPHDIKNIKHPIIGYFGSLTDDNDKESIEHCAINRPNWSFVFIGEVMGDYSRLKKLRNVYFLGPKSYELIPNFGQCFDVCLMNWIPHEWITYSFPIKALEYLCMGKPVVSVRIAEIARFYGDLISIADSKEEYLEKIEFELKTDSEEKKKKRIVRVKGQTWEKRVTDISKTIEQLLGK